MRFNRLAELRGVYGVLQGLTDEELKSVPQLYRADVAFAEAQGSTILSVMVERAAHHLTQTWKYISIDTRTSMLVPGMYPCIPGWHVDDFWRPDGKHTDLLTVPEAEHLVMNLGTCSNTVFVGEDLSIDVPTVEQLGDKSVHAFIHHEVENRDPTVKTLEAGEGRLYRMYPTTIHRGTPAKHRGWRVFFRMTGSNHRTPKNEIRTQSQVYMSPDVYRGW